MWVKLCANTSIEDAQRAIDAGADAVGFVFAPSARRVTLEQAAAITSRLVGEVERVGVFQTQEFAEIRDAVTGAGLSGVQLHGGYGLPLARRLRNEFGRGVTIAQTLHWEGDAVRLVEAVREMRGEGVVDRVLVDSKVGTALGGTGRTFDWDAAEAVFAQADGMPMIVAGGLNPENVGEAIRRLRPWGVDVASGVEVSPGKKDWERVRLFVQAAERQDIQQIPSGR